MTGKKVYFCAYPNCSYTLFSPLVFPNSLIPLIPPSPNCFPTHSTNSCSYTWSPQKDTLTLLSRLLSFLLSPRTSLPPPLWGNLAPSLPPSHPPCFQMICLPTRVFTLFSSCAKGNHPWKMFWPAVIAASHMLPILLTPEPRVHWNEPLEDTHTCATVFIPTNNRILELQLLAKILGTHFPACNQFGTSLNPVWKVKLAN